MRAAHWWIDRWRFSSAFREMSLAAQGAYRNLLDEVWIREGPLPADEMVLAALCGSPREWPQVRDAVLAHFVLGKDGWHNQTAEKILRESKRKARNQARYRDFLAAKAHRGVGNVTGNVVDNVPRSLDPAEKNKNPESDAGARAPGGAAPAGITHADEAAYEERAALPFERRKAAILKALRG